MIIAELYRGSSAHVSDSFLSNAGWLFFAGWSAILVFVSTIAFAGDITRLLDHAHPLPPERPGQTQPNS